MKAIASCPVSHTQSQPLHLVAYGGGYSTAEALLECGVSLLAKNKYGDTFFHIAIRHG